MKSEIPKYKIVPEYLGKVAYTMPPAYDRQDSGMFILDETLSQKDLGYLFEVIGYEGVEVI